MPKSTPPGLILHLTSGIQDILFDFLVYLLAPLSIDKIMNHDIILSSTSVPLETCGDTGGGLDWKTSLCRLLRRRVRSGGAELAVSAFFISPLLMSVSQILHYYWG